MSRFRTRDGKKLYGIMAEFDSPKKLVHACEIATAASGGPPEAAFRSRTPCSWTSCVLQNGHQNAR